MGPKKFANTQLDLDELIGKLLNDGPVEHEFPLALLSQLFAKTKNYVSKEPSLLELNAPLTVCGDIHGHYADLLNLFQRCGWPYQRRYLFLGDMVDRGRHSLEVIVMLFAFKCRFPNKIFLLRGNHEIRSVNRAYGFLSELRARYPEQNQWQVAYDEANKVFCHLPLAAVVCGAMLCLHGGLSPSLHTLDDIKQIQRGEEEPTGLTQDLLWSDPSPICKTFSRNAERGCSFVFGDEVINERCNRMGIAMIVRGHQVVNNGAEFSNKHRVLTLFTAAGYADDYFNTGAVMHISTERQITFTYLTVCRMKKTGVTSTVPRSSF